VELTKGVINKAMIPRHLTQVLIKRENLIHNMKLLSQITQNRPLWPAIKANAYGHGAGIIAKNLVQEGYSTLCVAHAQEAINLINQGVEATFILLTPDLGEFAQEIRDYGLQPVVTSYEQLEALSREAKEAVSSIEVHIKVDTGMGRVGFQPGEMPQVLDKINRMSGIHPRSVMSHFPRADEADPTYSLEQINTFKEVIGLSRKKGISLFHMANSAAIFHLPESHFDLTRPGISIYGLQPSQETLNPRTKELKPVLRWETRIVHLKKVPPGQGLSYGHSYVTPEESLIATIPLGYGDGLLRGLSNNMEVLVQGQRCPQVGRICMDQCLIDVTSLGSRVKPGDSVVIIGSQGNQEITAEELAQRGNTINYEIVTQIAERIPRIETANP